MTLLLLRHTVQSRIEGGRILLLEESICTPYNDLYVEAMTERAAFFRLQVFKRVRISPVEVYLRVGKYVS